MTKFGSRRNRVVFARWRPAGLECRHIFIAKPSSNGLSTGRLTTDGQAAAHQVALFHDDGDDLDVAAKAGGRILKIGDKIFPAIGLNFATLSNCDVSGCHSLGGDSPSSQFSDHHRLKKAR